MGICGVARCVVVFYCSFFGIFSSLFVLHIAFSADSLVLFSRVDSLLLRRLLCLLSQLLSFLSCCDTCCESPAHTPDSWPLARRRPGSAAKRMPQPRGWGFKVVLEKSPASSKFRLSPKQANDSRPPELDQIAKGAGGGAETAGAKGRLCSARPCDECFVG